MISSGRWNCKARGGELLYQGEKLIGEASAPLIDIPIYHLLHQACNRHFLPVAENAGYRQKQKYFVYSLIYLPE